MSRKTARRYAFELIFQFPFQPDLDAAFALDAYPEGNLPGISGDERQFVTDTVSGVGGRLASIDDCISINSEGWEIGRLNSVDLAALRLAVYEMLFTETPAGVSINEAVDLAKLYSGEESGRFVNGVLTKVYKEREARHA